MVLFSVPRAIFGNIIIAFEDMRWWKVFSIFCFQSMGYVIIAILYCSAKTWKDLKKVIRTLGEQCIQIC